MTETKKDESKKGYEPPPGSVTDHTQTFGGRQLAFKAHAEWLVLHKKDEPLAEMFHVAYLAKRAEVTSRPLTFVFNGGPGAASAYLHMGALGPHRVCFDANGTVPKPPVKIAANQESWLPFTDLVFIDPIGTGFSRMIKPATPEAKAGEGGKEGSTKTDEKEFFKLNRDLESLGEFISRFLSKHRRWESPIFIAGESYGGFRTACMAKRLQEQFGVGLNGVIIISPALEFVPLNPSDYDLQAWTDVFPTMAAAAMVHGRSRRFKRGTPLPKVTAAAEAFAQERLARLLARGDDLPARERAAILQEMSEFIGIPADYLEASEGRIAHWTFAKKLLKDERKICGLYDASITAIDPFPNREWEFGPDPTLSGLDRVFAGGINTQLRKTLKLETERDYHLLSHEVNKNWQDDRQQHFFHRHIGATDELRYGMALNPHMKVFLTHGAFDLVTPYYASTRLVKQMRLLPDQRRNLTIRTYAGGHMFYSWDASRQAFRDDIAAFYHSAL
ncbi:MAG: carboxypeptidase-related protein [Candidatus Ozemobacter sibiricus]|jgi:carboxypeptidase C (cathepsin A)|uniref:Carboxypeptidase-related protein n=1 Tax=Candidatus Ozemobacter sibiricus TaxID=2268124 RepID=A0A367ZCE9_9BACT|nr:MAG: carboxypeptidase-related protein [Candidatus Ozemobacter sibiricus]